MLRYIFLTVVFVMSAAGRLSGAGCPAGHSVAFLGDSMTWIGGDSCDISRGWTSHFVKSTHPVAATVYARSGATWTNAPSTVVDTRAYSEILDDRNVMLAQAFRLMDDVDEARIPSPDMIFLYAGANDVWFGKKRPGIFSDEVAVNPSALNPDSVRYGTGRLLPQSLAGSVALVCDLLKGRFPAARLVLMTPAQMSKSTPAMLAKVSEIIDSVGRSRGITVIRLDRDGPIMRSQELKHPGRHTDDGIHTNPQGAAAIAQFVRAELDRFLNQ